MEELNDNIYQWYCFTIQLSSLHLQELDAGSRAFDVLTIRKIASADHTSQLKTSPGDESASQFSSMSSESTCSTEDCHSYAQTIQVSNHNQISETQKELR